MTKPAYGLPCGSYQGSNRNAPKGRQHDADDGDFDAAFAAFKAEKQVTPRDNLVVIRMTYQDAPNRL